MKMLCLKTSTGPAADAKLQQQQQQQQRKHTAFNASIAS
jgi:hypothetical protein